MEDFGKYFIAIDGKWSLEDLYKLPRAYEQVYFATEALLPSAENHAEERIIYAFKAYPWQGGYSAVNFYNQLKYATPRHHRPSIASIRYASPGWIELVLNLPLAAHIGLVVTSIAGSIKLCNSVYHSIYSDLQKRKLLRIEVERSKIRLTAEEMSLVADSAVKMASMLGMDSVKKLNERTGDPLISLKILLSVYRRMRLLAEYKERGKAEFPTLPRHDPNDPE